MSVFAALSLMKWDAVRSRVVTGALGVLCVGISVFSAFGIMNITGFIFTPTIMQVLPFLALGLGMYVCVCVCVCMSVCLCVCGDQCRLMRMRVCY